MDRLKRISTSRIARELELFSHFPPPGIFCYPNNDLLNDLEAIIAGTEGTPYENANFKLSIQLPDNYPFSPPIIRFVTPIYHPNIDSSGRICLSILKEGVPNGWSVALGLQTTLLSIQQLFSCPGTEDPLVIEICDEYRTDYALFARKARAHARQHAIVAENVNLETVEANPIGAIGISKTNTNSIGEYVIEEKNASGDVLNVDESIGLKLSDSNDIGEQAMLVESMIGIQEELTLGEEKESRTEMYKPPSLSTNNSNNSGNSNNQSLPLPSRTQPAIDNDRPKKKFKLGTRKGDLPSG
jgi:ubiquitin-conjugating enzyme E2 T